MGTCVMCRRNSKEPSAPGVEQMKDGEIEDLGWRGHGRPDHMKPKVRVRKWVLFSVREL